MSGVRHGFFEMDHEAFCRRWGIGPPAAESAWIFDREGRGDSRSGPPLLALCNLAARPFSRKLWRADIAIAPQADMTVVLPEARPWLQGSALARCSLIVAARGSIDVFAVSEEAIDELANIVGGLLSWVLALADRDADARDTAWRRCAAVLMLPDINQADPSEAATVAAIADIMTLISTGGNA
jgi:hypothetical protein